MSGASTLHDLLKIDVNYPVFLTSVQLLDWGRTLIFTGTAGETRFTLRYEECREFRWRTYVSFDAADTLTPLVDFAPGRDQHRSPAQFLTGTFGLSLFYGSLTIQKEDAPPAS